MRFGRAVLWFSVVAFGFTGLVYVVSPIALLEVAGITGTASGLTDVRAIYGGFQLGLAAFLVWCVTSEERVVSGLVVLGLMLACIGASRIIGLTLDQAPTTFHLSNLAFEIPGATIAFIASRRVRASLLR